MEFDLPFPPSMNHLWRRVGARMVLSRGGRAFREAVGSILAARGVQPLAGPLEIVIDVHPPDRRRRDLDNLQKALLDALQHGGAYHDDSQIARLTVQRRHVVPAGKVHVRLTVHRDEETTTPHRREAGDLLQRTCLKCGQSFESTGPGHRICRRCARVNARLGITEKKLRTQRGIKRHNGVVISDLDDDEPNG